MRARSTKHGQVGTPTYRAWQAMISRVTQCGNSSFKNYGGRGITVCERWRDYEAFYADMGEKPAGKTLDRKNNNGNYEPTNCRWATKEEQDNNKRTSVYVTFNGQTRTLSQWGRVLKTDPGILRRRWIKFQTLNPIPRKGPTNGSNRDASGRFKANS